MVKILLTGTPNSVLLMASDIVFPSPLAIMFTSLKAPFTGIFSVVLYAVQLIEFSAF